MRRSIALLMAAAVVGSVLAGPALAAKKKTVTEDWTATNPVPYPVSFVGQGEGCQEGEEGVTKTTHAFTAPGTGTLEVTLDAFEGDWDLFLFDSSGNQVAASDAGQVISMAPPGEKILGFRLRKGQEIGIVACNWLGGPTADAHLTYVYK